MINPLYCFFGSKGHVALDRNPGPGYNTLLLWLIPGDRLSACRAALRNSNPNALRAMQEAVCTNIMVVIGTTRSGREPTTYHARGGHVNN